MSALRGMVLAMLLLVSARVACPAATVNLDAPAGRGFFIVTRGTPMRDVLHEFASGAGLSAVVSDAVTDVFAGEIRNSSAREVLQRLSRSYGLAWYVSGNVLYVGKAQEARELTIAPTWLGAAELLEELRQSDVFSSPFCTATLLANLNAIDVYGLPQCLTRVKTLVGSLDVNARHFDQDDEAVLVFPLRYASAIDSTYTYRNQQVTVPGVVTELREMSQNRALPVESPASSAVPLPPLPAPSDTGTTAGQLPLFSADARENAVIVRDRRANMGLYRSLIPQLDRRPVQIEIAVDIIDIDAGNLRTVGVDVSGSTVIGGTAVSLNSQGSQGFSTVLGNSTDFLARITALEQSARAKILSRPSVVTLNNVQAVLDRNITFYTKLQGRDVAKLESVATGSLLRVTPRLIEEHGTQEIMLTLDIQDGQQQPQGDDVDSLPQVQNSAITTQAILRPGQSLLLGGFIQKEDVSGQRRIPWLADIPLLGALFRQSSQGGHSVVRLFLIKARPLSGMAQQDVQTGTADDGTGGVADASKALPAQLQ